MITAWSCLTASASLMVSLSKIPRQLHAASAVSELEDSSILAQLWRGGKDQPAPAAYSTFGL